MDTTSIMLELAFQLGKAIGGDCALGDGASDTFRQWFDKTVGPALQKNPKVWTPEVRRYTCKQVDRIGREACRVAHQQGNAVVTVEILDETIREVILKEQQVCDRAQATSKLAEKVLGKLGPLCELV